MWDLDHKPHPSGRTKGLCIIETLSVLPSVRQHAEPFARTAPPGDTVWGRKIQSWASILGKSVSSGKFLGF